MSDADLRERERRWKLSGSPEDEAALLSARLHAGDLSEAGLRLMAHLGHVAACAVLGWHRPASELGEWTADIQPLGGVVALRRAAVAAAELALAVMERSSSPTPPEERIVDFTRKVLDQARIFVLCPCSEHMPPMPLLGLQPPTGYRLGLSLVGIAAPPRCREAVLTASSITGDESQVRAAIRGALVSWAAGAEDPLRAGWAHPVARLERLDTPGLLQVLERLTKATRGKMGFQRWFEGGWRETDEGGPGRGPGPTFVDLVLE